MCGINGFNFSNRELIEKMNVLTKHRGPDGTGVFVNDKISLGHNRLAIIDLSSAGAQPMFNHEKTRAIVFNGEIYNFRDLREELENSGYKFSSQTDTEVILNSYDRWGKDCVKKFNGIFAFAIADLESGELFLARDHLGVKPLYYYFQNGKFIFSSEIKTILADDSIPRRIDLRALNLYLRLRYIPAPFTIWENIYKFPQGHCGVFSGRKLAVEKYWSVENFEDIKDREEIKYRIKTLVDDAVKIQLVSDRPLGLFLSGGIDSTVVLGAMAKLSDKISTFSVGFEKTPEEEKFNRDFYLARQTAQHYGTDHHELVVSHRDIEENLPKAVYHMDEPVSNPIQTVNMLLASNTVNKATVILGGDGGDEIFGGYERYFIDHRINHWQSLLHPTAGLLRKFASGTVYEKLFLPPGADRYLSFWSEKENMVSSIFQPEVNRPAIARDFFREYYFQKIERGDFTKQFMLTDLLTWLPDESLVRSDKMAMAVGMEYRVPLLDYRLVELGFRIPTFEKIKRRDSGKEIFKEAMADYLPPHLVRESKRGWFSPAAKWVRKELKPMVEEILSPGFCPETSEFFDFEAVRKIFENHCTKRRYALNIVWSLITFQVWFREYMGKVL